MQNRLLLMAAVVALLSGCTHAQLRRSTVSQVGSVADIYQQQVLNNLARFARDSNALPDFGVPTSGVSTVSDTGSASHGLGWNSTSFTSAMLGIEAQRNVNQNWALKPVQDPRKLELMRCAYQQAVGKGGCTACCPDCQKRFAHFYTGDPCGEVPAPCQSCPDGEVCDTYPVASLERGACNECVADMKSDTGTITAECLGSCWFHVGCSDHLKQIKAKNPCCLVGEHCGTVVWVTPGRGTDELAKLTIAILDFAVNDPKEAKKKEEPTRIVRGYFDGAGNATTPLQATYEVVARLGVSESSAGFEAGVTAESFRRVLLGQPITPADLRPLESNQASSATKPSGQAATRADAQLEIKSLPPSTFLPQE